MALLLYPYPSLNVCQSEDDSAKISTQELAQGLSSLTKDERSNVKILA